MLFTSYEFILAAALVFLLYYLIPKKWQWPFLLVVSYLFYFKAGHSYVIYIAVTTVVTWFAARKIGDLGAQKSAWLKEHKKTADKEEKKAYKAAMGKKQKGFFLIALFVDLGLLIVMKYTNFMIENINGICKAIGQGEPLSFWNIALPLGISFYTFMAVSYLIDVYNEKYEPQRNLAKFALYVSFFPQLVQGPISRYNDLSQTLYEKHYFDVAKICRGLQRVLWGFFKKLVIADRVLIGLKTIIGAPEEYQGVYVFVGMMFYALQLYCDFTGGIDITIGMAEVMQIKVQENFYRPFFSKNIKEYWNRWHMTMGSWFTDYIFYPVSVSKWMLKLSKFSRSHLGENIGKRVPVYLCSLMVWFTTGIWHGASWNFIAWGLANCIVILISQELTPLYRKFHERLDVDGKLWYKIFCVVRTVLLMSSLRIFDCYESVGQTIRMYFGMFTAGNLHVLWDGSMLKLGMNLTDYVIAFAGLIILVAVSLVQRKEPVRDQIARLPYPAKCMIWFGLFLIVLLMGAYGQGYDESQFIYNQF